MDNFTLASYFPNSSYFPKYTTHFITKPLIDHHFEGEIHEGQVKSMKIALLFKICAFMLEIWDFVKRFKLKLGKLELKLEKFEKKWGLFDQHRLNGQYNVRLW